MLAHLRAQQTRRDPAERAVAKVGLIRRLYEQGFGRKEVLDLFRLIDWFLQLPDEREEEVWRAVQAMQEERNMPHVTSVERIGIRKGMECGLERGRREGLLAGLEQILDLKFGEQGRRVYDRDPAYRGRRRPRRDHGAAAHGEQPRRYPGAV